MYCAKLAGRDSGNMTVAMYQEDGANEQWRQHVAKYELIRHPNIMQLYGLVTTQGLRAMVFHDEMIPFHEFFNHFRNSPILTTYILAYCTTEWIQAMDYFDTVFTTQTMDYECAVWIRPATGQLSLDLVGEMESDFALLVSGKVPRLENVSLDNANAETAIILTLHVDEYHDLCSDYPISQPREVTVSTQLPIPLGSMFFHSRSQPEALVTVTEPLDLNFKVSSWSNEEIEHGELMANSWIRYNSHQVHSLRVHVSDSQGRIEKLWLSQANYIFTQLQTRSHFEDYVCPYGIIFDLRCLPNTYNTQEPEGYLFVCPPENFRTGQNSFQWPTYPAYWSLNPTGATPLSTEDAKILGFPTIHMETLVGARFWDQGVYLGLRRFHRGKGFDPESQQLAMHLSHSLYQISNEMGGFACAEGLCNGNWDKTPCRELGHYL
ncbi:hypothetical protein B0H14DRAFT_2806730 [Mycena olivaceomarginata]|nr:hypothetical protein B0H14DRAFT_2806730 [Mycena olivaceomarginata]